jgi:hypothetical protein
MGFIGVPQHDVWVRGNADASRRIHCRRIQDHFTPGADQGPWARAIQEAIIVVIPSDDLFNDEQVAMRLAELLGFKLRNSENAPRFFRRRVGHVYGILDFRKREAYIGETTQPVEFRG